MDKGRWVALCALGMTMVAAAPAEAAFPGDNGKPAFSSSNTLEYGDGATGERAVVTPGPGDVSPAWSPDGERLAFASRRDGSQDIWVMNADGTGLRNVTNGDASQTLDAPAWSYDGTRLAFENSGQLEVINADGSGRRALGVAGTRPAWEPGDATLLFSRREGIYRVPATGGTPALLIPGGQGPDVSPDGTEVAYAKEVTPPQPGTCCGSYRIFAYDRTAGTSRPLSPVAGDVLEDPAWSPDGTRITWMLRAPRGDIHTIYVADSDGTGANQQGFAHAGYNAGGSWQPILPPKNRDPDCTTVGRGPWELGRPNHRFERVILFGGDDADGDRTWIAIDDVQQDEALTGRGDHTRPDARRTRADNEVLLRSERQTNGDGRVYTVKFTLYDERGGSCQGSVQVGVRRHNRDAARDSGVRYSSFSGTRLNRRG